MTSIPAQRSVRRWTVSTLVVVTFLIVSILCWVKVESSSQGIAGPVSAPASLKATQANVAARSRMMEVDPNEKRILSINDNAATYWRKAITLTAGLSEREKDILENNECKDALPNPPPTKEEISALLKKVAPIIALLRKGATKAGCDWSLHTSPSKINHYDMTFLAIIGRFDAAQRVAAQPAEAVEDLKAMIRLGNIADRNLIGGLVNASVQEQVHLFLAEHSRSFSSEIRSELKSDLLNTTALMDSFRENFSSGVIRDRKAYANFDIDALDPNDRFIQPKKEFLEGKDGKDIREAVQRSKEITAIGDEMLTMSDEDFQNWQMDYRSIHPFMKDGPVWDNLDDYVAVRERARETIVEQAMARTALAIMDEGKSALNRNLDPFTGKPFGYSVVTPSGAFILESQVQRKGEPIEMTFQRNTKK